MVREIVLTMWVTAALVWVFGLYHFVRFNVAASQAWSTGKIPKTLNLRLAICWRGLVPDAESHRRKALWSGFVFTSLCVAGLVVGLLGKPN
jgi:hypothetical protein